MRVLILNHADVIGGAGIAGYRLHTALRKAGVRSSMLVGTKGSHDSAVAELRPLRTVRRPIRKFTEELGLNELDGISAYRVTRRDDFRGADVVHYHAIHGGWFSYPVMQSLTAKKPSVLTLHDMWPFTGHCSFDFGCGRWATGCGSCPHPETFPAIKRDATALEWKMKRTVWGGSKLVVVSPSAWLADLASASMLGEFEIRVIRHGLDTDAYSPRDQVASRRAVGLPVDDPVVLFAASSFADRRKGADLLLPLVDRLPTQLRKCMSVLLMGDQGSELEEELRQRGVQVTAVGFVTNDRLKAVLYSAADAFVFPTRNDNVPLVLLESLSCGTPVVSFAVGGISELVRPDTGYLAEPEDVDQLAHLLETLLEDRSTAHRMGGAARTMVVGEYNEHLAAERHANLYRQLIGECLTSEEAASS